MKPIFAVLLAAFLFWAELPAFAYEVELPGGKVTSAANVSDSSNTTFAAVAGVANQILRVHGLLLSVSTADNLTIKCGTTTKIGPIYLGVNGGLDLTTLFPFRIKCAAGEALNITKGTNTTPVTIFTLYTQEAY